MVRVPGVARSSVLKLRSIQLTQRRFQAYPRSSEGRGMNFTGAEVEEDIVRARRGRLLWLWLLRALRAGRRDASLFKMSEATMVNRTTIVVLRRMVERLQERAHFKRQALKNSIPM